MAAKKQTYECVAYYGCGFQVGKKQIWLDEGDTIELTAKQAELPLAQRLIQPKEA